MYNTIESSKVAGDLAFHILYNDLDKMNRDEAEDAIAVGILSGYLPPLTISEVDLAFEVVEDIKKINMK